MKIPKKILIIIQRSNGDVLLSSSLIKSIYEEYDAPKIDLLINDDTNAIAKLIPFIHDIHFFSYMQKKHNRWSQEKKIISKIFKKYDLSISLTASDRSVFYGIVSAKKSISAVEIKHHKSWWKKIFLTHYYYFDNSKHLLLNNLQSLQFLNINVHNIHHEIGVSSETIFNIKEKLKVLKITNFFIFHPSAQYSYKVYPQKLRDILLSSLSKLDIPILITGGKGSIDNGIKKQLPSLNNVFDFIGETSLEEFFALSKLSLGYIGMDTLNMHIAASQNKRVFAIFGPTNLKMWSPWSNQLKLSATKDQPKQTYGNITVFQANMPCVACGKAGCDNNHGNSDCLDNIDPATISKEVESWIKSRRDYIPIPIPIPIPIEMEYSQRKVLLYIVYGDDQTYYDGAIFSFLTFKNWILEDDQIEVVVLTEKPEKFSSYSINLILFYLLSEKRN